MTTTEFSYGVLAVSEIERLGQVLDQCFISPRGEWEVYRDRIGLENYRVLRQNDQVVGGLGLLQMGEWFGGCSIPMGGVAAVGIAPEYRGTGAAMALMQNLLQELRDQRIPIATLYSAAQPLYRKLGYEQAGTFSFWEIPTSTIKLDHHLWAEKELKPLPLIKLDLADANTLPILKKLYWHQAQHINGFLDRHNFAWEYILRPEEEVVYGYLFGDVDKPQGYIIFNQNRTAERTTLQIRDWVLLTPTSVKQFWQFLNAHRSQIDIIQFRHSLSESLTLGLVEQTAKLIRSERWLLRIVDVVQALNLRGYNPYLEAELHLEITQDPQFFDNNGKFILHISKGRSEVTHGGKAELKLDIRSLAALYTGLLTPFQLQLAGRLIGEDHAIQIASLAFAGNAPWRPDFF